MLQARGRLVRRLLSQDSWGVRRWLQAQRGRVRLGEVPRKIQQHLMRKCDWQGCLAGSGVLQSKAGMMSISGLGRLGEQ